MIEKIKRYEFHYFNCFKSIIVSYLSLKRVPIELIFYNAFESSDDLLTQIIIDNKRWSTYNSKCINTEQLQLLGYKINTIKCTDFNDAELHIKSILSSQKADFVILPGDNYYVPHLPNYRKNHAIGHTFMLYGIDSNKNEYSIIDEQRVNKNYFLYHYPRDIIRDIFDNVNIDGKYIGFIEKTDDLNLDRVLFQIEKLFSLSISDFYDSQSLYANLEVPADPDMLEKYVIIFALLQGSRQLFKRFLMNFSVPEELISSVDMSSQLSQKIKNLFILKKTTQREGINKQIVDSINKIKENESKLFDQLNVLVFRTDSYKNESSLISSTASDDKIFHWR